MRASKCFELEVIVNGKPVYEYPHEGDTFIEGRANSKFSIKVKNFGPDRVLAVVSVDGTSVMDGDPAHSDSPGIIVPAYGEVVIPGWALNTDSAAQFEFVDRERAYTRGSQGNHGVIGALIFNENQPKPEPVSRRVRPDVHVHHHHHHDYKAPYSPVQPWMPMPGIGYPLIGTTIWTSNNTSSAPTYQVNTTGVVDLGNFAGIAQAKAQASTADTPEQLGVGFGERVDFKLNTTTFDKGQLAEQIALYYDSRKNLERRGIVLDRREYLSTRPNPFPGGIGCKPPTDWKG